MEYGRYTTIKEIFDGEALSAGESVEAPVIDVGTSAGMFVVQVEVSGSGTLKLEWLGSLTGDSFVVPEGASEVFAGFTASSGPGGDGKAIYSFSSILIKFLKLKLTETSGTDGITVSMTIAIQ